MSREKRGPLALEAWAKQLTDGYRGVTVRNMTTSWRNGLAFCALIHRFRPDLIEYEKLDPSDIIGNCSLAFEVAESKLGIPALLDPEDMAAHEVPDRLSVLTYVAQYYNTFKNSEKKSSVSSNPDDDDNLKNRSSDKSKSPSPEKVVSYKRRMEVNEDEIMDSVRRSMPKRPVLLSSPNVCSECQNPVYISERVIFMKKLYHRTCFRCSNCNHVLNPQTAEYSPDGLLFCLENACHLELHKRSRESFISANRVESDFKDNENDCSADVSRSDADDLSVSISASLSGEIVSENSSLSDRFPTPLTVVEDIDKSSKSSIFRPIAARKMLFEVKDSYNHGDKPSSTDSGQSSVSDLNISNQLESESQIRSESSMREPSDILVLQPDSGIVASNSRKQWFQDQFQDPSSSDVTLLVVQSGDSQSLDVKDTSKIPSKPSIPDKPVLTVADQFVQNVPDKPVVTVGDQLIETVSDKPVLTAADQLIQNVPEKSLVTVADQLIQNIPDKPVPTVEDKLIEAVSDKPVVTVEDRLIETVSDKPILTGADQFIQNVPDKPVLTAADQFIQNVPDEPVLTVADQFIQNVPDKPVLTVADQLIQTVSDKPELTVVDQLIEPVPVEIPVNEGNKSEVDYPESKIEAVCEKETELSTDISIVHEVQVIHETETTIDTDSSFSTPKDLKSVKENTALELKSKTEKQTPSPRTKRRAPLPKPLQSVSGSPSPVPRVKHIVSNISRNNSTNELRKNQVYYPQELNPFESEENINVELVSESKSSSDPKNPFEADEDEVSKSVVVDSPKPLPRKTTPSSEINNNGSVSGSRSHSPTPSFTSVSENMATNFTPPQPSPRRTVKNQNNIPPKPYNPFEDEDDIGEFEDERTARFVRGHDETSSTSSKLSNLSGLSGVPTPTPRSLNASDIESSGSTRIRSRKNRRAPLPPSMVVPNQQTTPVPSPKVISPKSILKNSNNHPDEIHPLPINNTDITTTPPTPTKKVIPVSPDLLKGLKNKTNNVAAQQYRKKRRAPPPRRRVDPLPEDAIKTELFDLEIKERELERQGITLESTIRRLDQEEGVNTEQLDEMMIQLWGIVNEKNDILRRQTELEYLRRGHRLEEMQAELEFQLRVLMDTPADQKQDDHADVEQMLLQQMLKLVDERNEVVDWLDYHRKLDREEDLHVSKSLTSFSVSNRTTTPNPVVEPIPNILVSKSLPTKAKLKAEEKAAAKAKAKVIKEDGKLSKKEKEKDKEHHKLKLGLFTKRRSKKSKTDEDKDRDESLDN